MVGLFCRLSLPTFTTQQLAISRRHPFHDQHPPAQSAMHELFNPMRQKHKRSDGDEQVDELRLRRRAQNRYGRTELLDTAVDLGIIDSLSHTSPVPHLCIRLVYTTRLLSPLLVFSRSIHRLWCLSPSTSAIGSLSNPLYRFHLHVKISTSSRENCTEISHQYAGEEYMRRQNGSER